jgi:hypothetical protein
MSSAVSPAVTPQPTLVPDPGTKVSSSIAPQPTENVVSARIGKLFARISTHSDSKPHHQKVDEELARVVMLLVDIQEVGCDVLGCCLEVAVDLLVRANPEVSAATTIINSVEQRLKTLRNPWVGLRRGSSPAAKVVFGMMFFIVPFLAIVSIIHAFGFSRMSLDPLDFHIVPLVCVLGAVGSFVSIMVRINEFAKLSKTDASVLLLTGFFKPWVGASFAFFIYMVLLSSGASVVTDHDVQGFCFVLTAAFLAGFSERFAQDVASRAEKAFGEITLPSK